MISANGGLPAHRYTPQVTRRWPRGSEPASGSSHALAEESMDTELKIERWQLRNKNEALPSALQDLRQQKHAERKVADKACKKLNGF